MENDDPTTSPRPTVEEAAAALALTDEGRAAVERLKTPLWYFLALGALIAPVGPVVLLLPDPPAGVAVGVALGAVWVALLVAVMALVTRRMGVVRWLTPEEMRPFGAVFLVPVAVFLVVNATLDPSWLPALFTVLIALSVVAFGVAHQRYPADAS